jgi:hypothetical protein
MSSIEQLWAQERNFDLGSLRGIKARLIQIANHKATYPCESDLLIIATEKIGEVLDFWVGHKNLSKAKFIERTK